MNVDLNMAEDLKNTGKGNLFVIFGKPDIHILDDPDGKIRVKVNGVDVFKPQTGEVVSDGPDGIACWFVDADAWATLNSDTSRPFEKPKGGRIAVKVINHLGDEVMKVFASSPPVGKV
jgi:adenine-specific DNA-methyltransferase